MRPLGRPRLGGGIIVPAFGALTAIRTVERDGADEQRTRFGRDGFLSPVRIMDESAAGVHRSRMERAETSFGPLHYQAKVYTILRSPLELATHPRVLDTVSALIGPNVLLWNATYIVKEPHAPDHVSWHQDRVSCHASSGTSEFAMRVNARRGPQRISGILARTTTRQWRAWRAPEGRDSFRHFGVDIPASRDFEPGALARQRELDRMVRDTMGDGTGDFGTRTT